MTTEDDFQAALDDEPSDHTARLVLADYLEERADPRAEGYRALGINGLAPQQFVHGPAQWTWWQWKWWRSLGSTAPSNLPDEWFDLLEVWAEGDEVLSDFFTRRAADNSAALAFSRLPAKRRAELLARPVTA